MPKEKHERLSAQKRKEKMSLGKLFASTDIQPTDDMISHVMEGSRSFIKDNGERFFSTDNIQTGLDKALFCAQWRSLEGAAKAEKLSKIHIDVDKLDAEMWGAVIKGITDEGWDQLFNQAPVPELKVKEKPLSQLSKEERKEYYRTHREEVEQYLKKKLHNPIAWQNMKIAACQNETFKKQLVDYLKKKGFVKQLSELMKYNLLKVKKLPPPSDQKLTDASVGLFKTAWDKIVHFFKGDTVTVNEGLEKTKKELCKATVKLSDDKVPMNRPQFPHSARNLQHEDEDEDTNMED